MMINVTERTNVELPFAITDLESDDSRMARVYQMAKRVAQTKCTVLLLGESGTGKSILAKMIHSMSVLAEKPFVTVNCPCLSRELLESELFGHKKGSFTGASNDTWGKVAAAEGGTLFLDEIGEMPLSIQSKLLRLLQDREYERVGETRVVRANVRVIAATNQNLKKAVQEGRFREDLYYRINVINITLPPLRERTADIEKYATKMLNHTVAQLDKPCRGFSLEAWKIIKKYMWPGNLRELRNAVEYASILSEGDWITPNDLPETLHQLEYIDQLPCVGAPIPLQTLEMHHINTVIANAKSLGAAARILDIDPATLYRKRKKWNKNHSIENVRI